MSKVWTRKTKEREYEFDPVKNQIRVWARVIEGDHIVRGRLIIIIDGNEEGCDLLFIPDKEKVSWK